MKKRPASSSPVSGSMPSVNENPRRRMRCPPCSAGPASLMCAVAGITGVPSAAARVEVDRVVLVLAGQRCAARLEAADRLLLVVERRAVPGLDAHADAAGDQIGAAAAATPAAPRSRPRRSGPSRPLSSPRRLFVPSLKPWRFRSVCCPFDVDGRAAEPELRPAKRGAAERDAREVANGVERDDRIVGARLHAEIAARSLWLQVVAGEVRQLDEPPRPAGAEAVALEERRPEAEGDREPRRRQAERLAGVGGRCGEIVVDVADRQARRHQRRGRRPVAEQARELAAGHRRRRRRRRRRAGPARGSRSRPGGRRGRARPATHGASSPRASVARRSPPRSARRPRRPPSTRSRRLLSLGLSDIRVLAADLRRHGRERLGERVDLMGERPAVARGERAVGRVPESARL